MSGAHPSGAKSLKHFHQTLGASTHSTPHKNPYNTRCIWPGPQPGSRSGRGGQSRRAGCVFYLFIFIYCFVNFLTFVNKIFVGHTVLNISIPIRRSLYMGLLVPFRPL